MQIEKKSAFSLRATLKLIFCANIWSWRPNGKTRFAHSFTEICVDNCLSIFFSPVLCCLHHRDKLLTYKLSFCLIVRCGFIPVACSGVQRRTGSWERILFPTSSTWPMAMQGKARTLPLSALAQVLLHSPCDTFSAQILNYYHNLCSFLSPQKYFFTILYWG